VWFAGEQPCNPDGSVITGIGARPGTQVLCEGVEVGVPLLAPAR
jgi:hypothetical protein